jgi:hypothetical protein
VSPLGYAGPERRRLDRTRPAPLRVLGRARLRPEWARVYPDLRRGTWYPIVDRNPSILLAFEARPPLPGYLFLDTPGKGRHVQAAHFDLKLGGEA